MFYSILLSFQYKNVPENATLKVDMLSGDCKKRSNERSRKDLKSSNLKTLKLNSIIWKKLTKSCQI